MDEPSIEEMSIRAVQEKWTKRFALRAKSYRSSFQKGHPSASRYGFLRDLGLSVPFLICSHFL
jgi:hypothetical protein